MNYPLNKSYRKCTKCKKLLPLTQYHSNGKTPNGKKKYKTHCKECSKNQRVDIYREAIEKYFGGFKCQRCGFEGHPSQFDCHHIDPSTKTANVSKLRSQPKKLYQEMQKCELLCANCHRLTYNENNKIIEQES